MPHLDREIIKNCGYSVHLTIVDCTVEIYKSLQNMRGYLKYLHDFQSSLALKNFSFWPEKHVNWSSIHTHSSRSFPAPLVHSSPLCTHKNLLCWLLYIINHWNVFSSEHCFYSFLEYRETSKRNNIFPEQVNQVPEKLWVVPEPDLGMTTPNGLLVLHVATWK